MTQRAAKTENVQFTRLCQCGKNFNIASFYPSDEGDDIVTGRQLVCEWRYGWQSSKCLMCEMLLAAICVETGVDKTVARHRKYLILLERGPWPPDIVRLRLVRYGRTFERLWEGDPLLNVFKASSTGHSQFPSASGERLLQAKLNIPLLRSWLRTSEKSSAQAEEMDNLDAILQAKTFRVIDCIDRRLVLRSFHDEYLALSYVWGAPDPKILTTLSSNLTTLSRRGALCGKALGKRRLTKRYRKHRWISLRSTVPARRSGTVVALCIVVPCAFIDDVCLVYGGLDAASRRPPEAGGRRRKELAVLRPRRVPQ